MVYRQTDETGQTVTRPCAIVGITPVDNLAKVGAYDLPLGTTLYTVEFYDGSDALVPEGQLDRPDTELALPG